MGLHLHKCQWQHSYKPMLARRQAKSTAVKSCSLWFSKGVQAFFLISCWTFMTGTWMSWDTCKIKGYITAARTLFSGVGQALYQAKLYVNHRVLYAVNRVAHFTEFALTLGCSLDDMDGTHDPHQHIWKWSCWPPVSHQDIFPHNLDHP